MTDIVERLRNRTFRGVAAATPLSGIPVVHPDHVILLNIEAADEIEQLRAQLPDGMKHCTIVCKECEAGHARLVATNWIDHGCYICQIQKPER